LYDVLGIENDDDVLGIENTVFRMYGKHFWARLELFSNT